MTLNEKKILALILKNGPLSKRAIQQKAKLSWSTVVKMVTRLQEKGLLIENGMEIKKNVQGKDAILYKLSSTYPLILSVDVEYSKTQILLTNLKKENIAFKSQETPSLSDLESVSSYLENIVNVFMDEQDMFLNNLEGIGISIPLFIISNSSEKFYNDLEAALNEKLNVIVKTSSPSQAYAYFLLQKVFKKKNSLVLVNRGGLGAGIILDGKLYSGSNRLAGEIGHIPLPNNTKSCHCGKKGCLETQLDIKETYRLYQTVIKGNESYPSPTPDQYDAAMNDLIMLWQKGDENATNIIKNIVSVFAYAIKILMTIIDIQDIYIAGYLGPHGKKLMPLIKKEVAQKLFIEKEISIHYDRFDGEGFLEVGPAHRVFEEYLEI
jgi:predicted NBD/HSP70 family sugar kinase/biotin operon repressor